MRYLLVGFGLFLLLTLFVRIWFIETTKPSRKIINESPLTQIDTVPSPQKPIFSGTIILKDNLLLKSVDYQEIESAIKTLRKYPKAKLDIYLPNNVDTAKINNTLRTILTDQGVLATRFQFLRKPTKLTKEFQILMQVK